MKCAHDMCTCDAKGGEPYCSEACRDATNVADRCPCGHDVCANT